MGRIIDNFIEQVIVSKIINNPNHTLYKLLVTVTSKNCIKVVCISTTDNFSIQCNCYFCLLMSVCS